MSIVQEVTPQGGGGLVQLKLLFYGLYVQKNLKKDSTDLLFPQEKVLSVLVVMIQRECGTVLLIC